MTRLDRTLELLERYDALASVALRAYSNSTYGFLMLEELRKEKKNNSPKNLSSTVVGGRTNEETLFNKINPKK